MENVRVFLVMVWELLSLELLLCHVHVSVPVCVVQLAVNKRHPDFIYV